MAAKEASSTAAMPPVSSDPTINASVALPREEDDVDDGITLSFLEAVFTSIAAGSPVEAVLILSSNLVLFLLIVTSPSLRRQTRCRLVLSIVCGNLVSGVFGPPFLADMGVRRSWAHSCLLTVVAILLQRFFASFVQMWGMALLLLHHVACAFRYEGPCWMARLPPGLGRALPGLTVASPWLVGALLLTPLVSLGLHPHTLQWWEAERCPFILLPWVGYASVALCFFLPALVLAVLVVVILCLRWKDCGRRGGLRGAEMGAALVLAEKEEEEEEEAERGKVQVAAAVATVVMTGPEHVFSGLTLHAVGSPRASLMAGVVSLLLADLLPFVLALLWMLKLPEIRARARESAARLLSCTAWLRRKDVPQGDAAAAAAATTSVATVSFRQLQDGE